MSEKLSFASDYMEGAHPAVLDALVKTNMEKSSGYGLDDYCDRAREKIRALCGCPRAAVYFLTGGTQTNATVIDALLRPWQGVVAAETGHIATHEAGAIELGGHKVLTLPQKDGKLSAEDVRACFETYAGDANREHMVAPGMVYISHPTELGTLYSKAELTALSETCRKYNAPLYLDGARLAYALGSPENDVSLQDLAALCDVFYIGGTKCGALFGEAVVIPEPGLLPHFFTIIKQHGALLAKGRLLGVQFGALMSDGVYEELGRHAVSCAVQLQDLLEALDYPLLYRSPTNQVFVVMENQALRALSGRVDYSFWEARDETHTVIRLATSWATDPRDVARLREVLSELRDA